MTTAYTAVTIVAAILMTLSAISFLTRAGWVVTSQTSYGVPVSWLPRLGAAKAAGAAGLLVGLAVPAIGVAAAIGLVLYFVGAVVTVARARVYPQVPVPLLYLGLAVACLVLGFAAL